MHDILAQIENLTRETAFEGEFVSMQAKTDATGRLWVEVRTRPKMRPFEVRVGNDDIERRRFTTNHLNEVVAEIHDGGAWIPVEEADWVTV